MATSATAGNFTCAQLQKVMVEVDRIWADNQQAQDYKPEVAVLEAIRKEQTARLQIIENPEKDIELKIYWAADCNTTLEDCDDECEIGGPEAEAQCKEYALDICKRAGFSITERRFRTSNLTREQVVAKSIAKRMKELDEFLAQTLVAKLNAFAGDNQFLGGIGDPDSGGVTYIAPSYWNADMYGYFSQVRIMNKLNDVFLVHGGNLFQIYWQAQMVNANQNQKDLLLKLQSIRSYWDMFNIDGVNSPDQTSYMISRGAVAFANKAYYPLNNPIVYFDQSRWSIESKSLPGVMYDVYYTNECIAPNDYKHSWTLYVKAGIFLNPFGCNDAVTGVIKFVCGENAGS
jgi:hypothetical protein